MKIVQRTLFILIAVLVAIFSVQNLTMVEVQFLAWSLVMPWAWSPSGATAAVIPRSAIRAHTQIAAAGFAQI